MSTRPTDKYNIQCLCRLSFSPFRSKKKTQKKNQNHVIALDTPGCGIIIEKFRVHSRPSQNELRFTAYSNGCSIDKHYSLAALTRISSNCYIRDIVV